MNKSRIPTIIGILILTLGLAAGVVLVQFRQIFKLGAAGGAAPKDVRIANISDSAVSVSWLTETESSGFVKWGESQSSLSKVSEDEVGPKGFTHIVTLGGLTPKTTYFFKINSAGDDYDNNGTAWQITTGPTLPQPAKLILISGSIISSTGAQSKNSLVYVSVSGTLLSTITSQAGTWVIPLSLARTQDSTSFINIDPATTLLEISVEAGPDGVSSAKIYPQSANPVPPMVLGQVYDLRNLPPNPAGSLTNASIGLPNESTASSRFQLPKGGAASIKTVTLDSTKTGEVVTTTKPEFFGSGPPGTKLTISVQSVSPISTSVSVDSTGAWQWAPPTDLSAGTHTITLSWRDASGALRTLTRTFIIQAAEGPAFISTPSASLTPSPSPSLTPTPTPSTTPSPTAMPTLMPSPTVTPTSPPTPATGSLTPTFLLLIMGISTIAFGVLLWKESF